MLLIGGIMSIISLQNSNAVLKDVYSNQFASAIAIGTSHVR